MSLSTCYYGARKTPAIQSGPYGMQKFPVWASARKRRPPQRSLYLRALPFARRTGIFARIDPDLAARRRQGVDSEHVGEAREVEQHVGDFIGDRAFALRIEARALRGRQPLKLFEQFGGFDRQRHREIFRRVELLPVARGGKLAQCVAQVVKVSGRSAHRMNFQVA